MQDEVQSTSCKRCGIGLYQDAFGTSTIRFLRVFVVSSENQLMCRLVFLVPQFMSPKAFNITKYSNWRWLVSKPTWIEFTSFWIAVIQLTPKTSVSVSRAEFHFQPWNSTGRHIDPFREECHGRWFTELTGNVMENIQRKRHLGVPKLASFCWAWTRLSGQSGCKKCPAGTSTYGDPGAAVLPVKKLKLKDVHDVILIDWFVGFADHRCWFAWKWIPFGRVWFECQGFECSFFCRFFMEGSLGESHAIGFTPSTLATRPSRFFHENLGSQKKTTTMGGFRGFGSKLASECVCAPQFFSCSASTFCGEKMDMKWRFNPVKSKRWLSNSPSKSMASVIFWGKASNHSRSRG